MHLIGMQSGGNRMAKNNIFFCVPAPPGISPGQRFRFEHYLPLLDEKGVEYKVSSFYTLDDWRKLYLPGNIAGKAWIVVKGFFKRIAHIVQMIPYGNVYVYREATPLGPPVFEWIIVKLLRKRMIFDFDDAIWIPVTAESNKIVRGFKWFSKTGTICRYSSMVSVGNNFLGEFARRYNGSVILIPTVVDTEKVHNQIRVQNEGRLTIGWTGTFSTLKYLDIILPVLQQLQEIVDFDFLVIADKDPGLPLKNYRFIKWSREKERDDLMNMHIGVMPLYDSEIELGKCGFKAIQYMSLGIPAMVSPVGVNAEIVDDGINGFVCSNLEEWKSRMLELLRQPELRKKMGIDARNKIIAKYSVKATSQAFFDVCLNNI